MRLSIRVGTLLQIFPPTTHGYPSLPTDVVPIHYPCEVRVDHRGTRILRSSRADEFVQRQETTRSGTGGVHPIWQRPCPPGSVRPRSSTVGKDMTNGSDTAGHTAAHLPAACRPVQRMCVGKCWVDQTGWCDYVGGWHLSSLRIPQLYVAREEKIDEGMQNCYPVHPPVPNCHMRDPPCRVLRAKVSMHGTCRAAGTVPSILVRMWLLSTEENPSNAPLPLFRPTSTSPPSTEYSIGGLRPCFLFFQKRVCKGATLLAR